MYIERYKTWHKEWEVICSSLLSPMRFVSFFCLFVINVMALSVQKEFQSPHFQLEARDDAVKQLKVANDILATLNTLSKDKSNSDSEFSQPAKKDIPPPETPTPLSASSPNGAKPSRMDKAKGVAASMKGKFFDFIKGKISALLAEAKLAAKSKVQTQVDKAKQAAVKKLSPPTKRDAVVGDNSYELEARGLVDSVMAQVFVALKRSGLINYVIRQSLTDAEVRAGVADITIELIRADVIPYQEVFQALQKSGLALDVVKFSLTDADTRLGLVLLVVELVPQLVEICSPGVLSKADFSGLATLGTRVATLAATGSPVV